MLSLASSAAPITFSRRLFAAESRENMVAVGRRKRLRTQGCVKCVGKTGEIHALAGALVVQALVSLEVGHLSPDKQ
jgi:hypothetical protein